MSALNLNYAVLVGRLTADVEIRQTTTGVAVCSFTLAVNRRHSREDTQQATDFITCQAWRGTAEFIAKYFKKGSALCIVGSIQTRSWDDPKGGKRYATDVVATEAYFVDSKGDAVAANPSHIPSYVPDAYQAPAPTSNAPAVPQFDASGDEGLPF